ncbi:MAG: 4-alpha-glucanotransferase, partial [Saccharofermentanaceae bacterium]
MQRGAGVLMHIASLPGPFGIGVFGEEAIDFAKQLKKQGMKYWQVLPFSYPGMGNSPYQSFSAFAGNRLFIDPRRLMRLGLLTGQEVVKAELPDKKWRIDYDFNKIENERFLRTAFYRIGDDLKAKIVDFASSHKWVDDVALYLTIKEANDNKG